MLTPTHLVAGQTAFLTSAVALGHVPRLSESLLAMVAAIVPDLDHRRSYIGRALPFISSPLAHHVGHRTLTHSLLLQMSVGWVAFHLLPYGYFLALVTGWASHSLADMMTPAGVCWFWPSRVRCVLPGNRRYRMASMGPGELVFLLLLVVIGLWMQPLASSGLGTIGQIRSAIGRISSARELYDANKGGHAWSLEVKGRDNRGYQDISGSYHVIGAYRESGFIVSTAEGARSICRSNICDWYADHAALSRGREETTTTIHYSSEMIGRDSLIETLTPLQSMGEVYLIGQLKVKNIHSAPPTVEAAGEQVRLRYASPERMKQWESRMLRNIDLTIQVRHPPGVSIPTFVEPETADLRQFHPLLKRWLDNRGAL
ncbi:MAG: metal-dependent hydrolase [Gammaproteobacteria bacterium]|nr:metal-dependent hydrolase [Gammaproteobacteria bacterium]